MKIRALPKVIKTPVDSEGPLPQVMKDVLGYPFYIFDDEQTPLELDPTYGPDMAQKFNLKVLSWLGRSPNSLRRWKRLLQAQRS